MSSPGGDGRRVRRWTSMVSAAGMLVACAATVAAAERGAPGRRTRPVATMPTTISSCLSHHVHVEAAGSDPTEIFVSVAVVNDCADEVAVDATVTLMAKAVGSSHRWTIDSVHLAGRGGAVACGTIPLDGMAVEPFIEVHGWARPAVGSSDARRLDESRSVFGPLPKSAGGRPHHFSHGRADD